MDGGESGSHPIKSEMPPPPPPPSSKKGGETFPDLSRKQSMAACRFRLVRVTASAVLGCPVNLKELAAGVPGSSYNPLRLTYLIIRRKTRPISNLLVWDNGIVSCHCASPDPEAARYAMRKYIRLVQRVYPHARMLRFRITGLSTVCILPFRLDLQALAEDLAPFGAYNSENFGSGNQGHTCLFWRRDEPYHILVAMFHTGVVLFRGARTKFQIQSTLTSIFDFLYDRRLLRTQEHRLLVPARIPRPLKIELDWRPGGNAQEDIMVEDPALPPYDTNHQHEHDRNNHIDLNNIVFSGQPPPSQALVPSELGGGR